MHLSGVDANLLVPLHVLLEEQSVARAARRLGLTPSATSHTLARLREALGDPLLVRAGRGLVRTPRGDELRPVLSQLVASMEQVFAKPAATPAGQLRGRFRVATADLLEAILLPELGRLMSAEAPLLQLQDVPLTANLVDALRDGEVDLAFSASSSLPDDIESRPLFEDDFVVLVRADHPVAGRTLTPAEFAELRHIVVSPTGQREGIVDRALQALGLKRHVAFTLATFFPAPFLVASSDHVVTLSRRFARPLVPLLNLHELPSPVPLPRYQVHLLWHARHEHDAAHRWLRNALLRVADAL